MPHACYVIATTLVMHLFVHSLLLIGFIFCVSRDEVIELRASSKNLYKILKSLEGWGHLKAIWS